MDGELNEKMRLKKFREEAKNICRRNNNVNNTSLMATFAEKVCFFFFFGTSGQASTVQLKSNFFTLKIEFIKMDGLEES